jgi:hypothetical protein
MIEPARPLNDDEQRSLEEISRNNSGYLSQADDVFEDGLVAAKMWDAAKTPLDVDKDIIHAGLAEVRFVARQLTRKAAQVALAGFFALASKRGVSLEDNR